MSTEAGETKGAGAEVAKHAPTEQQESRGGAPKRFGPGQTVCSEKNEKGKLCNGHLKQAQTRHPAEAHLRGDDVLHQCQTCGALYMGPPLGHLRDPRRQRRFVERDLAAILQAAGGTLPVYDYPRPYDPPRPGALKPAAKAKEPAAKTPAAKEKPAASAGPPGETPEQKKARLIAEHKAKLAAKAAAQESAGQPSAPSSEAPTAPPAAGSSPDADRHRPAAEAQAATGQASAAPMSPAAATASPAAGAETVSDLAPEASTELTPGAPKDEREKKETD